MQQIDNDGRDQIADGFIFQLLLFFGPSFLGPAVKTAPPCILQASDHNLCRPIAR